MFDRTCGRLILSLPFLVAFVGCDTRPKIVFPKEMAPPAPNLAGSGGGPAAPAPNAEPAEKPATPKDDAPAPDGKK